MNKKTAKRSEIKLQISLNKENHPVEIHWKSDDNPSGEGYRECKAMFLSLFDKSDKDTYKIDLWTPEMQITEMDRMVFQTLRALTDTYFKATKNTELANDMQKFVHYFGEQTHIIPKEEG